MKVLFVVLVILMIASVAQAEVITKEVKTAIVYNFDNNSPLEAYGTSIKEDIFIKGLDADLLIANEIGESLQNDEQKYIAGLSYNYDVNSKLSVLAGVGLSLSRFEKLENSRMGEIDKVAYAGASYSF